MERASSDFGRHVVLS